VLKSVIGVAFLATPHRGSSVANLGSVFGTIVNAFMGPRAVRTDLLNHLIYDSDALQKLSTSARNRLGNISVVSCYENNPTAPLTTLVSGLIHWPPFFILLVPFILLSMSFFRAISYDS
jgi:hypothetical protein